MKTASLLPLLLSLAAPSFAYASGGGGMVIHHESIQNTPRRWAGGANISRPGDMTCFGGEGFGAASIFRLGGEGHVCAGEQAKNVWGGAKLGLKFGKKFYFTSAMGVGGGVLKIDDYAPGFAQTYMYLRPTVGVGLSLGWTAVEANLYAMTQVPLYQALGGVELDGPGLSHAGAQVSWLFGSFNKHKRRKEVVKRPVVIPPPSAVVVAPALIAIPVAIPAPPQIRVTTPHATVTIPAPVAMPLAIPGGAPAPLTQPMVVIQSAPAQAEPAKPRPPTPPVAPTPPRRPPPPPAWANEDVDNFPVLLD